MDPKTNIFQNIPHNMSDALTLPNFRFELPVLKYLLIGHLLAPHGILACGVHEVKDDMTSHHVPKKSVSKPNYVSVPRD